MELTKLESARNKKRVLFISIVLVVLTLDLFFKWYAGYIFHTGNSTACPYPQCSTAILSFGEPCLNIQNSDATVESNKEIIPGFFYIHLMNNTGAAWSFGSGNNSLFIIFNIFFAIGSFYFMLRKKNEMEIIPFICWSMIVGGAFGNFYDRLVHNSVRDFLSFLIPLPNGKVYAYPVFNVADMCICIGAILYLIDQMILVRFRNKKIIEVSPSPMIAKENGQ